MNNICLIFTESKGTINKDIYGHFTENLGGVFYDGLWVGEDSKVENIRGLRKSIIDCFKKINPPVLRWPGGCFAETYNWRDGIGDRCKRPVTVNWWYNNDKRTESNQVGTHEFMDFCQLVGAEPYFAANITSTTSLEIRNWMEYCNFPADSTALASQRRENGSPEPFNVKYWGIGNENWGGGGNMTPRMYAEEFRRYKTVCESVNNIGCKYIACGPNSFDFNWTKGFFEEYKYNTNHPGTFYGFALHYYCGAAGHPLTFDIDDYYRLLSQANEMQYLIERHRHIMDYYDPKRSLALIVDEWGCWHQDGTGPSKGYNLFEQQITMRDALVSGLTLNIFNDNCDVVQMANAAQLCNNLHTLFLASEDKFTVTPNYYVFDMYKHHQNAKQIRLADDFDTIEVKDRKNIKSVSSSASVTESGDVVLTLVNMDYDNARDVKLSTFGGSITGVADITVLANDDPRAHNTFDQPDNVRPTSYTKDIKDGDVITLPKSSVVSIIIKR